MKTLWNMTLPAALTGAALLWEPSIIQAEVPDYPNTPLVYVAEIGNGWVWISTIDNYREEDAQSILEQVDQLADFTCRLYDRVGIVLSQSMEVDRTGMRVDSVAVRYLVACAIP